MILASQQSLSREPTGLQSGRKRTLPIRPPAPVHVFDFKDDISSTCALRRRHRKTRSTTSNGMVREDHPLYRLRFEQNWENNSGVSWHKQKSVVSEANALATSLAGRPLEEPVVVSGAVAATEEEERGGGNEEEEDEELMATAPLKTRPSTNVRRSARKRTSLARREFETGQGEADNDPSEEQSTAESGEDQAPRFTCELSDLGSYLVGGRGGKKCKHADAEPSRTHPPSVSGCVFVKDKGLSQTPHHPWTGGRGSMCYVTMVQLESTPIATFQGPALLAKLPWLCVQRWSGSRSIAGSHGGFPRQLVHAYRKFCMPK
ncbi:hypothetical protein P153DRAFT_380671 [Dothidotthia symphoricarpi CBS 119687]|uniref:Uncharacterized protein n=1 Tax=Dothidotthia symphoricarpi CBS 119687 TaxID=1392245 RepID=A0A6A6AVI3_9PLEO|nr:uncharacterized protein P153DRAFT_380671 [Dothidotthia symphoricarpi CBS 119687]KAF2134857.1 hypothetical protein P153DRAFT_380671 [Dothidotthia symphoricarpi CBS 119687]